MKAYTDLEQSKKLAEILPLESANQTWERIAIAGANLDVPEELQYRHNGDMPFKYYSSIGLPCWSLTSLLDILPEINDANLKFERVKAEDGYNGYYYHIEYEDKILIPCWHDNPVDACVAMIENLHELEML